MKKNLDQKKGSEESKESESSSSSKKAKHEVYTKGIFADPTYDITFKMLFANDAHKNILISLLNSLLGFTGDQEIQDVTIQSPELQKENASGVKGAVDVLCETKNGKKIAVEMQRQYKEYFLPRLLEYMSKIVSGQVMVGQSKQYHKELLDTYILAIGKDNIFKGIYEIASDTLFEKTVKPIIIETGQVIPGNKMCWKFFELRRFAQQHKDGTINKESSLKFQWLNFLLHCSEKEEIPEDMDPIIQEGYNIMKVAKWDSATRVLYWKQKADERSELLEAKRLQEEQYKHGFDSGQLKGEIKGEISKVKFSIKYKVPLKEIASDLQFLTHNKVKDKLEQNINYIQDHINDTDSDICEELGLLGELPVEDFI